ILWDWVGEAAAHHALEGRDLARRIEIAEHIVEGTVLEHDHDDMVQATLRVRSGHSHLSFPFIVALISQSIRTARSPGGFLYCSGHRLPRSTLASYSLLLGMYEVVGASLLQESVV